MGVDDTKYTGDFTYHAVREMVPGKKGYWEVAMDDFQINGVTVIQSKKGVIDSGTSLLALPTADMKNIAKLLGAKTVLPIPPFNKKFTLEKADYIIDDAGECLLGATGIDIPAPAG